MLEEGYASKSGRDRKHGGTAWERRGGEHDGLRTSRASGTQQWWGGKVFIREEGRGEGMSPRDSCRGHPEEKRGDEHGGTALIKSFKHLTMVERHDFHMGRRKKRGHVASGLVLRASGKEERGLAQWDCGDRELQALNNGGGVRYSSGKEEEKRVSPRDSY